MRKRDEGRCGRTVKVMGVGGKKDEKKTANKYRYSEVKEQEDQDAQDEKGKKVKTWDGLKDKFAPDGYLDIPYEDVKDRLLFSQVLEAIRIMEEGVCTSVADGNIGSIMGIGFPPHTGGVFQCVNAYGVKAFAERAGELEAKYGEEFKPPRLLLDMAERGETFG